MSQVSVDKFVVGIKSICSEKPKFKAGHDGSTHYCDGVGLLRGGLLRSGATKVKNMKESNQCARFTLQNVHVIDAPLKNGDILLKSLDIDDSFMPLPAKYRIGGSNYNGDLTNYSDIGVVTKASPLEIVHMTSKGIKKEKKIGDWEYVGWLPYVMEERRVNSMGNAIINSVDKAVKVYAKPSFACDDYFELQNGDAITVLDKKEMWAFVQHNEEQGYVLAKFVNEQREKKSEITLDDIKELEKAYEVIGAFLKKVNSAKPKQRKRFSFLRGRK